jgi:uncharacterized protein (DUF362 family)
MISIVMDPSIAYPDSSDFFSPNTAYPEYVFDHLAIQPNRVYEAVRRVFSQAGLDRSRYGSPDWNPLGEFIKPGSRVFVLCNFVNHRRPGESLSDFSSKCTHGSVLRAVLDYVLSAVGAEGQVHFGNAPLQSCNWDAILCETGAKRVEQFYQGKGLPVKACDLRLWAIELGRMRTIKHIERRGDQDIVAVDLESASLLSDLDRPGVRFRVINYDPRRIEEFQQNRRHVYLVNRQALEADVILSIPKLKTHEKVGITCSIKGCVGIVAHKDCLAHHRFGPPHKGGDEYPSDALGLKRAISHLHDAIQGISPENPSGKWLMFLDRIVQKLMRMLSVGSGGAWWGNDTAWRMAVDLCRILAYASPSGKLQHSHKRPHLSLIDGIVGGEGEGPLAPSAVNSGILIFSDNVVRADYAAAMLMGYDPAVLPIVWNSAKLKSYPLLAGSVTQDSIICNGIRLGFNELRHQQPHHYRPPCGWKEQLSPSVKGL